jgi:hypothetical protein
VALAAAIEAKRAADLAAVLAVKSTVLAKTLLASIAALLAVVKAVLVNEYKRLMLLKGIRMMG